MDQLREYESDLLNKHISFFEMVRREDEDEIASRFDVVTIIIVLRGMSRN